VNIIISQVSLVTGLY